MRFEAEEFIEEAFVRRGSVVCPYESTVTPQREHLALNENDLRSVHPCIPSVSALKQPCVQPPLAFPPFLSLSIQPFRVTDLGSLKLKTHFYLHPFIHSFLNILLNTHQIIHLTFILHINIKSNRFINVRIIEIFK